MLSFREPPTAVQSPAVGQESALSSVSCELPNPESSTAVAVHFAALRLRA